MTWQLCKELIVADLCRELHKITLRKFLYYYIISDSFKVTLWLRIGNYLRTKSGLIYKILLFFVKLIFRAVQHKTGIQVPLGIEAEGGLKFFHFGCIVIAASVKIGKNVSIHQGVTIGRIFSGTYSGVPTIGDNVVVFAGAKILGNIKVGDGAVIGANAVVTKDVPVGSVVAGIPAKVISEDSNKCFTKEWGELFSHNYNE